MSSKIHSNVTQFPQPRSPRSTEHAIAFDPSESDTRDVYGNLALDMPQFQIDEPDPLLISEMKYGDTLPHGLSVIENAHHDATRKTFRLKDIHPLDALIICGFMLFLYII